MRKGNKKYGNNARPNSNNSSKFTLRSDKKDLTINHAWLLVLLLLPCEHEIEADRQCSDLLTRCLISDHVRLLRVRPVRRRR